MTLLQKPLSKRAGRALYIVLSFLIPFFIIMVALAGLGITPFGDRTLVISDANGLYINTLAYAGRMLRGLEGITYSFEKGLGGNMTGHLNGILLTPFAFLFSLTGPADYPTAFTFVSTLNLSLGGLTMYLLLSSLYGHRRSHLIFSTSYALMGFSVANVFQACFFCAAPALPLMVLGLKKILEEKNPLLYLLSIAYGLLTSAYFGYVLCVASVLFFFTGLWLYQDDLKGRKLRVFAHYALSSLCGGLLPIAVWLPGFLSLRGGRLDQTEITDFSLWENMPFLQIGAKLFTGANNTSELVNGLPNIFVGILPLALAVLFFLSKAVDRRKKAAAGFLLGVYLLSFWIVSVNMLMHAGTTTNWFNYRYSYVFSFLLLLLAAELWEHLNDVPYGDMKRCLVGMLLVTVVVFAQKYEFVKAGYVVLDYLALVLIFLAWRMHRQRPEVNPRRLFEIIALVLVCVNLFLNYRICTENILDWGTTLSDYQKVVTKVDPLVEALRSDDFYRMEINRQRSGNTGNDPMLYGYDGVGHGGSNERNFVRQELSKLGVPWFDMRAYYADGIPAATDALLGIRFVISSDDLADEKGYVNTTEFEKKKMFGEEDEYWDIYMNENVLPPAMLSTSAIHDVETDFTDVFENLNRVWAAVSGERTPVLIPENDITFTAHSLAEAGELTAREAREITAYYDAKASASSDSSSSSASVSISAPEGVDTNAPEYTSYIEYRFTAARDGAVFAYRRTDSTDKGRSMTPAVSCVGRYKAGDEVVGYIPMEGDYVNRIAMEEMCGRFRVAYADEEALADLCKKVNARSVTVTKEKETRLTGDFTAEKGQTLLFTIPWDEGWTCTVDGQPVELEKVLGVFMAADVPEGTHHYEMRYVPAGLRIGLVISAAALLTTLAYVPLGRKRIDLWFDRRAASSAEKREPDEQTPENEEKHHDSL